MPMSVAAAAVKVPVTPLEPMGRERLVVKRMTAVGEVVERATLMGVPELKVELGGVKVTRSAGALAKSLGAGDLRPVAAG